MGVTLGYDDGGVRFEDGCVTLRDGRTLAWRVWGRPEDPAVLRLQGTVGSRLSRGPDPTAARRRVVMADRPGFGGAAGWTDETPAITGTWDYSVSDVAVPVEWWHGSLDTTVPLSAARRLTAQLPQCDLHVVEGGRHHLGLASILLAELR